MFSVTQTHGLVLTSLGTLTSCFLCWECHCDLPCLLEIVHWGNLWLVGQIWPFLWVNYYWQPVVPMSLHSAHTWVLPIMETIIISRWDKLVRTTKPSSIYYLAFCPSRKWRPGVLLGTDPTVHRTALTMKGYTAPNASSAEKSCFTEICCSWYQPGKRNASSLWAPSLHVWQCLGVWLWVYKIPCPRLSPQLGSQLLGDAESDALSDQHISSAWSLA